jgi:hypothetical protein
MTTMSTFGPSDMPQRVVMVKKQCRSGEDNGGLLFYLSMKQTAAVKIAITKQKFQIGQGLGCTVSNNEGVDMTASLECPRRGGLRELSE